MITRTQSFQTSNGQVFGTIEEAQRHELGVWIQSKMQDMPADVAAHFATELQKDAAKIIDTLTTTATSKPKARRVNGGTKKRKGIETTTPAPSATPSQ